MSYLLYWNPDVIPEGPYNIAAVRFSSLVGVEYIRIVPAGCAPFINEPSIVGRTHPDAFGLQLYLNVNFPADAPQSGPPNALGTSSLVYTGEDLEHDIVLSPKAGTRLMVFKGNFTRMSIAIYGRYLSASRTTTGSGQDGNPPNIFPLPSYSDCNPLAYANGALGLADGITPSIGEAFQAIDYPTSAAVITKLASEWPLNAEDSRILVEASNVLRSDFGASSGRNQDLATPTEVRTYITFATLLAVCDWANARHENDVLAYALLAVRRFLLDADSQVDIPRVFEDLPRTGPLLVSCLRSSDPGVTANARALLHSLIDCTDCLAAWGHLLPDDLDPGAIPQWALSLPENLPDEFVAGVSDVLNRQTSPRSLRQDQIAALSSLARRMDMVYASVDSETSGVNRIGSPEAYSVLEILQRVSETLELAAKDPGAFTQSSSEQAIRLAQDYLNLLLRLLSHLPLVRRTVRQISGLAVTLNVWTTAINSDGSALLNSKLMDTTSSVLETLLGLLIHADTDLSEALEALFDAGSSCTSAPIGPEVPTTCVLELLIMLIAKSSPSYEIQLLRGLLKVLPELEQYIMASKPETSTMLGVSLIRLDRDRVGLAEWFVRNEVAAISGAMALLVVPPMEMEDLTEPRLQLFTHAVDQAYDRFSSLLGSEERETLVAVLAKGNVELTVLDESFRVMIERDVITLASIELSRTLSGEPGLARRRKLPHAALILLRSLRLANRPFPASECLKLSLDVFESASTQKGWDANLSLLIRKELGYVLATFHNTPEDMANAAPTIVAFLDLIKVLFPTFPISLPAVSEAAFDLLVDLVDPVLPPESAHLSSFKPQMEWLDYIPDPIPVLKSWRDPLVISPAAMEAILVKEETRPTTPTQPSTPPNILGMAALSPFNMMRSPTAHITSLSKTYSANDFRSHRTSPNVNTSRPPSMHVDDFQTSTGSVSLPPSTLSQWSSNAM